MKSFPFQGCTAIILWLNLPSTLSPLQADFLHSRLFQLIQFIVYSDQSSPPDTMQNRLYIAAAWFLRVLILCLLVSIIRQLFLVVEQAEQSLQKHLSFSFYLYSDTPPNKISSFWYAVSVWPYLGVGLQAESVFTSLHLPSLYLQKQGLIPSFSELEHEIPPQMQILSLNLQQAMSYPEQLGGQYALEGSMLVLIF